MPCEVCGKGEIYYPKYGHKFCGNALCDYGVLKKHSLYSGDYELFD